MLRALLALGVLANVLFFAWAQGWLAPTWPGPRQAERESGRIGAQVRPELIVVLPSGGSGTPAPPARLAALACMEAGPFDDAEIGAAEAALKAAALPEGSWAREQVQSGPSWVVFAGRYPDAAARQAREEELKRVGLPFTVIDTPVDLAPGFVISRHASRDAAELALAAIGDKPIGDVRVVALPPPPLQHWLRAAQANPELQSRLFALDRGFKPCVTRR